MGSGGSKNKQTTPVASQLAMQATSAQVAQPQQTPHQNSPPISATSNNIKNSSSVSAAPSNIKNSSAISAAPSNTIKSQNLTPNKSMVSENYESSQIQSPDYIDPPHASLPEQSIVKLKPERKVNEKFAKEYEPKINEVLETPNILFFFDFHKKTFNYYNITLNEWNQNDLNLAEDDCPDCPLFKYKISGEEEEAIKFAKYLTYIAHTDETVYIIGGFNTFFSCLEYNIKNNFFTVKKPMKVMRNNPSLCKYNKYIYAISGDNIDTFSKDASVFDTKLNEWTALKSMPSPQGFAAVRVVYESKAALDLHETSYEPKFLNKNYEKNLKIAALGGLSSKFPRTYNPLFSLYSFNVGEWKVFDLSKIFTQRIPKFINCSMVQRREGDLMVVGSEGTKNIFKFDFENLHLAKSGSLPHEDTFGVPMRSRESLYNQGQMFCLSHKNEGELYQGDLKEEKWEVILKE